MSDVSQEPAAAPTPKKVIPHPDQVPVQHHDKVIGLVAEQFLAGHYGVKEGSVTVTPINDGEDGVYFVRTHNPAVEAQPHGLDLS